MKTKKLSPKGKGEVLAEWEGLGVLEPSDLMALEAKLCSGHQWQAVVNGDEKTIAVFEIRKVLKEYIKNMDVQFSPRFDWGAGRSMSEVKEAILEMVQALSMVFEVLLEEAKKTNGKTFKIHSQHKQVHAVFMSFGEAIEKGYPDKYSMKMYQNWVEIEVL